MVLAGRSAESEASRVGVRAAAGPELLSGAAGEEARTEREQDGRWLIPRAWLDVLDESVAWRGADGCGRFRQRVVLADGRVAEVALVHRRLSIIDHAGGAQPMRGGGCPACARKGGGGGGDGGGGAGDVVVFNGCIYNHRELRDQLVARGHRFESDHSDTEVILHASRQWGEEIHEWLDGMFAAAVWRPSEASITLIRDRFGEKPLFWREAEGGTVFAFGSVASGVARLAMEGAAPAPLGRERAMQWAARGWASRSPWPAVGSVACGGVVSVADQHVEVRRPVPSSLFVSPDPARSAGPPGRGSGEDPARSAGPLGRGDDAARTAEPLRSAEDVGAELERAVASRLEADVPLACLLSGGVDSTLIACLAARARGDVPALSVRMPDEAFDESAMAAQVAKAIGMRHEVVECSPHAAADLEMLIERLGVPFADSSLLPTYWVCQAVAGHAKVALSGDGGDELFYGYARTRAASVLTRWGFLLRLVPEGWLDRRRPGGASQRLARMVDAARGDGWTELTSIFGARERRALFGSGIGAGFGPRADDAAHARVRSAEEARAWDIANYLPDDLLRKVDAASLAAGVEVRCPFLHPGLAARALATPRRTHMRGGERKHLLRELVRTLLPAREAALVADRPKQGFAVPISRWFREDFGGLRGLLLDRLTGPEPFGVLQGVLPVEGLAVRRMIDEHWAAGGLAPVAGTRNPRPRDHGQRLYGLLVLALWARTVQI